MSDWFGDHPRRDLWYLPRAVVIDCCREVDVVAAVDQALRRHARGQVLLPDEAHLAWQTPSGAAARSLAMPAALRGDGELRLGVKIINGSLDNPARGLPRAQGLLLLFDADTAWPAVVMEAAYISAMRTAAVSAVAAHCLGAGGLRTAAVIGCGALARAHLALLPGSLPGLDRVVLYDTQAGRAERLAADARRLWAGSRPRAAVASSAAACVAGADLVVTVTTATAGYLRHDWLRPGALVMHVSLDDVLPEVVDRADLLVVDDWELVSSDHRRLLGRLYRQGRLRGPDGSAHPGRAAQPAARPPARAVDATLGGVLIGACPGRSSDTDVVLCNPFGMAVLDLAVAGEVWRVASRRGLGRRLPA